MLNQSCAFVADKKPLVLLVDDEPQVLVALEDILGDDFLVFATDQPERALRLVEEQPEIAVVISDQRMPRMNGNELLARLRERSAASRVLSTGYADISAVVNAVNDGRIFAYVTKPWDENDVPQKVRTRPNTFGSIARSPKNGSFCTTCLRRRPCGQHPKAARGSKLGVSYRTRRLRWS